jgi:pSer/pThr/pTyr-binding forkhead associated (FHA) protein
MGKAPSQASGDRTVGDFFDLLLRSPSAARGQFGTVLALVPLEPWELLLTYDGRQSTQTGEHMVIKTAIGRQTPALSARPFPLPRVSKLVLGRSREAGILIDQPTISRAHAELVLLGDDYEIHDCDSRNGTLVNGRMLDPDEKLPLRNGDVIGLGEAQLLFGSLDHFAVIAKGHP